LDEERDLKQARNMALRLLTYRARSGKEVYEYLRRKGFNEPVIKKTIDILKEYSYLDDQKFAEDFINYRKNRGFGLIKIRYELIGKGVDKEIIDSAIENNSNPDDDLERVKAILTKRIKTDQPVCERFLIKQSLFLKKRGFQDKLIIEALKEYQVNDYNYSE
jgi:regulatory protein